MKPVIIQTLIQAAKRKNRSSKYAPQIIEKESVSGPPRKRDHSGPIVVIAQILFIVAVLLFNAVSN